MFTFDSTFDAEYFTGSATASLEVPGRFECAFNDHAYMIDRAADLNGFRNQHHSRASSPIQRNQADVGEIPSEQSLNRENLWRRGQESWHKGSGQSFYDRTDSDPARFSSSKGVYVWDKWSLSLLPDTARVLTSANTNLRLTSVGAYTYVTDGNSLKLTADITTTAFTTVTGTPGAACSWVTSDGYNVYAAYGASGIYSTTRGAASAASFNTVPCTLLGYVHGRLMAANANSIYNITDSNPAVAPLLAQANTDFAWVGFAEGPGFIYAAGFSGNRSLIYKIGLTTDSTSLSAPIVAQELPTGEIVRSIKGYLGFLIVGTDLGLRVGNIDSAGNITLGALIPTSSPVLNFETADRFVWYGLTNYDSSSTGLGRIDLSVFTQSLTPAYATDLMATTQGAIQSISSASSRRVFTVSGSGVWLQTVTPVTSGTLTLGKITYGVGDDKVAVFFDLRHQPLNGSISVNLGHNGQTAAVIGSSSVAGSIAPPFALTVNQQRGEFFEPSFTLNSLSTTGPVMTRWTLRAYPAPPRTFLFTIPLIIHESGQDLNSGDYTLDTTAERRWLESLCRSQQLFTYAEAGNSYTVLMEDFTWVPIKQDGERVGYTGYDGTFVAQLREIAP